jgi:hypothetical protein
LLTAISGAWCRDPQAHSPTESRNCTRRIRRIPGYSVRDIGPDNRRTCRTCRIPVGLPRRGRGNAGRNRVCVYRACVFEDVDIRRSNLVRPSRECIQSNGGQLIRAANRLGAVSNRPYPQTKRKACLSRRWLTDFTRRLCPCSMSNSHHDITLLHDLHFSPGDLTHMFPDAGA